MIDVDSRVRALAQPAVALPVQPEHLAAALAEARRRRRRRGSGTAVLSLAAVGFASVAVTSWGEDRDTISQFAVARSEVAAAPAPAPGRTAPTSRVPWVEPSERPESPVADVVAVDEAAGRELLAYRAGGQDCLAVLGDSSAVGCGDRDGESVEVHGAGPVRDGVGGGRVLQPALVYGSVPPAATTVLLESAGARVVLRVFDGADRADNYFIGSFDITSGRTTATAFDGQGRVVGQGDAG